MAIMTRRIVFTGIGILSPVGCDPASYRSALLAGCGGVRALSSIDTSELPVKIGGEILDFNPKLHLDKDQRRSLKVMARTVQLGVVASTLALKDAGTGKGKLDPDRFGIEFGAGMIASELDDLAPAAKASLNCQPDTVSLAVWGQSGMKEVPPLWMLKYLPNMPACHASIIHDARGPSNSITESDVASLLALGEAYRILGRDAADVMLVGGTESKLNPLSLVRHSLFSPLVKNADPPGSALRPFDRDHSGTVLGEAAGVVVLEDLEHARRRGAKIYAEMVGFASGFDRARKGDVLAGVIRRALAEAGANPSEVDHVNGHGVGIPQADAWEANAIRQVFGGDVPVYTAKAAIGHSGAAGGTTELIASVQSLAEGSLPGTLNHERPDAACPVRVHTGQPRPIEKEFAVKLNFTDMGQCAVAVVRRWRD